MSCLLQSIPNRSLSLRRSALFLWGHKSLLLRSIWAENGWKTHRLTFVWVWLIMFGMVEQLFTWISTATMSDSWSGGIAVGQRFIGALESKLFWSLQGIPVHSWSTYTNPFSFLSFTKQSLDCYGFCLYNALFKGCAAPVNISPKLEFYNCWAISTFTFHLDHLYLLFISFLSLWDILFLFFDFPFHQEFVFRFCIPLLVILFHHDLFLGFIVQIFWLDLKKKIPGWVGVFFIPRTKPK